MAALPDETNTTPTSEEIDVTKVLTDVGVQHLIGLIKAARHLLEGEVTGDNIADETITPDKLVGMIIGGGSSTGELEDLTIRTYSFTNAGSGWNRACARLPSTAPVASRPAFPLRFPSASPTPSLRR